MNSRSCLILSPFKLQSAVYINTIVRTAVYLSMFYFFNNPRSSMLDNYDVLLCVVYCVTGIAYALAIYFEPGQDQLVCTRYFDHTIRINSNRYPLLPRFSTNKVLTLVASKDSVVTAIIGVCLVLMKLPRI